MSCQGFPECSRGCACDDRVDCDLCPHCGEPSRGIDGAAFDGYCSTLCAVAVERFEHDELCDLPECQGAHPCTLPRTDMSATALAARAENALRAEVQALAREGLA